MTYSLDDYRSYANTAFDQIATQWASYNNYWRVGSAFDTLINYFLYVNDSDVSIAADAVDYFNDPKKNRGCWFDDFGWWGLALLRAAKQADTLGVDGDRCVHYAKKAWLEMDANAPKVWDKARTNPNYAGLAPRFPGGCWNNYFYPDSRCANQAKPCDPTGNSGNSDVLCGIQNTVTNGLYLGLAARLSAVTQEDSILASARREWSWFEQWFFNVEALRGADLRLLNVDASSPNKMLVRERVSVYAQGSESLPPVWGYGPCNYWTGDQGVVLGAMVDLIPVVGLGSNFKVALSLVEGVSNPFPNGLVDELGVLQPWKDGPDESPFDADPDDYSTGIGVYARYLLYAFQESAAVGRHIQQTQTEFLRTNADAVCDQIKSRQSPELPGKADIDGIECRLNQLSVLTAAFAILGSEQIAV